MGYTAVLFGLSAFLFCIQVSYGNDVVLDSYAITAPADIEYNRVTDIIITFTATASAPSGGNGGNIEGIDVYFADTNDDEIAGTRTASSGGSFPVTITAGATPQDLAGNTATLKFATEAACTAATQLCVLIKGAGVTVGSSDVQCLAISTTTGQAGPKDCTDVALDSYEITNPAAAEIEYNRMTDTIITFTATASAPSGGTGGDIDGIDVYFAEASVEISGTRTASSGGTFPVTITAGATPQDLTGNTATILKFATEAACTAATQLCVQIKGSGVTVGSSDVQCLAIGTTTDPAGAKDCADAAVTATTISATQNGTDVTEPGSGVAGISNGIYCVLISLCIYTAMIMQ